MGLCEQVICHDDTLHLAAMFTCSKTVSDIHLRTFLLFISSLEPRGDGGAYASYAQRLFDLRDVLPANLLKGNATPRPHDGRREIVVHEC